MPRSTEVTRIIGPMTVIIDTDMRSFTTLSIDEKAISLTPRQSEMLSFLAENANGWVSKAELYQKIWTELPRPEPKIVDVFVCTLRRKITRGLPEEPPKDKHYLVSDLAGHYGLFAELLLRVPASQKLGPAGVGKQLKELQSK